MSLQYLIDGYNLLYALPEMPAGSWQDKRASLVRWLQDRRPYGQNRVIVVFDSREGLGDQTREGEFQIIYTAGETADDWISRRVRDVANPRVLVVVTDDQGLRRLIRGTGAKWISTKDFTRGSFSPKRKPQAADNAPYDDITEELKKKWL
jgi:predicted RNA-binding protein with PIN domain